MVAKKGIMTKTFLAFTVATGTEKATLDCELALRERSIIQNAVFCEESFGKIHASYVHFTYKDVFGRGRFTYYIA